MNFCQSNLSLIHLQLLGLLNKVYFLDGIDSWNEKIYGKTIKVKGKLLIEKIKEIPKQLGLPIPQQMIGTKRTILKPYWELIK